MLPTWLLLETDWASTKQAARFMPMFSNIVSIAPALVRGDDDEWQAKLCMVPFDARHSVGPRFHAQGSAPMLSRVSGARNAAGHIGRSDLTPGSARTPVGNAPIADD